MKSSPSSSGTASPVGYSEPAQNPSVGRALALLATVTLAGTLGFVQIEGWPLWKGFYFTLVTITTVGYSDEGISEAGQKFATFLLIGGVASASYAFATLVQTSVANQLNWRSKMEKQVRRLRNHTIVCGFGRMGRSVCEKLAAQGETFVVIEREPHRFREATRLGFLAVEGNASEDAVLESAGVASATHIVAAVDSIAENIVISMGSHDQNPGIHVIARAERDEDIKKLERAGVNRVLCPFQVGGRETVDFILRPHVADFLAQATMGQSDIALADVRIAPGSPLIGTSLRDYGSRTATRISYVALNGPEGSTPQLPPPGSHVLEEGDHLIVAGDPDQIAEMTRAARPPRRASSAA